MSFGHHNNWLFKWLKLTLTYRFTKLSVVDQRGVNLAIKMVQTLFILAVIFTATNGKGNYAVSVIYLFYCNTKVHCFSLEHLNVTAIFCKL